MAASTCDVICTKSEDVGCAIMMTIPVKFCSAHGRSRPEVGSGSLWEGRGGVSRPSLIFGTSDKFVYPPYNLLGAKTKLLLFVVWTNSYQTGAT